MQNNNKHIKTGFKTPDNYFEKLEAQLLDELNPKMETGFTIPNDYFKNVNDKIIATNTKPTKVIALFSRKNFMYASSIAAALVLGVYFLLPKENNVSFNDVTYASLIEYTDDEFKNTYEIMHASDITDEDLDDLSDIPIDEELLLEYLSENENIEIDYNNL